MCVFWGTYWNQKCCQTQQTNDRRPAFITMLGSFVMACLNISNVLVENINIDFFIGLSEHILRDFLNLQISHLVTKWKISYTKHKCRFKIGINITVTIPHSNFPQVLCSVENCTVERKLQDMSEYSKKWLHYIFVDSNVGQSLLAMPIHRLPQNVEWN